MSLKMVYSSKVLEYDTSVPHIVMAKVVFSILLFFVFLDLGVGQSPRGPRLRPIQEDGKWGFIDTNGNVVIKPQFYWVEEFSEGLAAFETDKGLYGYIDETGEVVIEPILERWSPFSEGLAAAALKNMKWGYIEKSGNWLIKPQFFYAHPFRDGFAAVDIRVEKDGVLFMGEEKSTMIDRTGKILIKPVPYVLNHRTSKGIAFLSHVQSSPIGGDIPKSLLIDRNDKVIFEGEDIELDGFSENVTPVKKEGKWGYIDATGFFVIQPRFAEAKSFSEGLAAVKVGEKWGYINHLGKIVIAAEFLIDELNRFDSRFSEGLALVYSGNDQVFIDKSGKIVLEPGVTEVENFVGGLARIKKRFVGGKEERGYINKQGKFVWGPTPFKYKYYQ